MKSTFAALGLSLAALPLLATTAQAQTVREIGAFRDWSAYAASENGQPLCFLMSQPQSVDPAPDGYSQAYLYLTNRPAEDVRFEFNLVAGYKFAPDTPAVVSVGGEAFPLFTENDAAWLEDPSQASDLAGVMRAGSTLVVEGTSERGIKVTQTFSLSGATAASNAVSAECA